MLSFKKAKKYKIFFTIIFGVIVLIIAVLAICLNLKIDFVLSIYSIVIALMSLFLAIIQINISKIFQDENDYKKFIITFLETKLKNLSIGIENYLKNMYINADMFRYYSIIDAELLTCPVLKEYFEKLKKDIDDTTILHKAVFENRVKDVKREEALFKEENNLKQIKITIIDDINEAITNLYNGSLQLSNIEKEFQYEREWFHK